jgi:hypothetical protein
MNENPFEQKFWYQGTTRKIFYVNDVFEHRNKSLNTCSKETYETKEQGQKLTNQEELWFKTFKGPFTRHGRRNGTKMHWTLMGWDVRTWMIVLNLRVRKTGLLHQPQKRPPRLDDDVNNKAVLTDGRTDGQTDRQTSSISKCIVPSSP